MDTPSTNQAIVIGCGPAGCAVVTILKEASVPAYLVAVDDSEELLSKAEADKKILLKLGEKLDSAIDFSRYKVAFLVLQPSEGSSLTYAQVIASAAGNAYTLGFVIKPSGGWSESEKDVYGSFDGAALIDEGWVLQVRKGNDPEYAMRISLNFTAHVLGILSEALKDGKLSLETLKSSTSGRVSSFAATATSEPETLYNMTMSKIDRSKAKALLIFMPEDTDKVVERRIFLMLASGVSSQAEIEAIRAKRVEPFRILAILST